MPLCLTFIDLKKAFGSVKTEAVVQALDKQGIPTQYIKETRNRNCQSSALSITLSTAAMLMKGKEEAAQLLLGAGATVWWRSSDLRRKGHGAPGRYVCLTNKMKRGGIAAVGTQGRCTIPFEMETGLRQRAVARPFLLNLAVDDIMRGTVGQCSADAVLAPSGRPLVDLESANVVAVSSSSSAKLQRVVDLVSKFTTTCGRQLLPDECKQT
ncbi:hypothetical protein RB195_017332 [Necator americanus]|uniref:Reverse transcriptase domain-containing protein n=1 Tax=Necator americanus TaxID=51031 RepID=A0ABR1C4Q9_NECAM